MSYIILGVKRSANLNTNHFHLTRWLWANSDRTIQNSEFKSPKWIAPAKCWTPPTPHFVTPSTHSQYDSTPSLFFILLASKPLKKLHTYDHASNQPDWYANCMSLKLVCFNLKGLYSSAWSSSNNSNDLHKTKHQFLVCKNKTSLD